MSENYSNNTMVENVEPEKEVEEELPEVTSEMLEGLKTLDGSTKVLEELYIMRNINERQSTRYVVWFLVCDHFFLQFRKQKRGITDAGLLGWKGWEWSWSPSVETDVSQAEE